MSDLVLTPENRFEKLAEWFEGQPGISREGRGFGAGALKIQGKIFAMLSRERLVVKLPGPRVAALVAAGEGEPFDPRRDGRLMKEWLSLAETSGLDWQALASEALEFVSAQK